MLDEIYSPQIASALRTRDTDAVSVHERPLLEGEPDDREVLRAATRRFRGRKSDSLIVRSLGAFAADRDDDEMLDDCQFLPRVD